ncbi:hypothetical protein BGZ46_006517, partial [Entomortierella lignicola]
MNIYWFVMTTYMSYDDYESENGVSQGIVRAIAYGASQALLLNTSIILFLVLRRSMLHAIGFTYPEIIPLHRWLGTTMLVWATIHVWSNITWLIMEGKLSVNLSFSDQGRGSRNLPGLFAW